VKDRNITIKYNYLFDYLFEIKSTQTNRKIILSKFLFNVSCSKIISEINSLSYNSLSYLYNKCSKYFLAHIFNTRAYLIMRDKILIKIQLFKFIQVFNKINYNKTIIKLFYYYNKHLLLFFYVKKYFSFLIYQ